MQVGSLISTSVDYTNQQKKFAPLMVLKLLVRAEESYQMSI